MSHFSTKASSLHQSARGLFVGSVATLLITTPVAASWAAGWGYNRDVDEMTDQVFETASITFEADSKSVDVSFICSSSSSIREPVMGVFTSQLLDYNSDKQISYLFRLDQYQAVNGTGQVPGAGKSFFIRGSHVRQIINGLLAQSVVKMRWPVYRSGNLMVQIPSDGLRPVLAKMSCIAPLLPPEQPSVSAPAVPAPPPAAAAGSSAEGSGR